MINALLYYHGPKVGDCGRFGSFKKKSSLSSDARNCDFSYSVVFVPKTEEYSEEIHTLCCNVCLFFFQTLKVIKFQKYPILFSKINWKKTLNRYKFLSDTYIDKARVDVVWTCVHQNYSRMIVWNWKRHNN